MRKQRRTEVLQRRRAGEPEANIMHELDGSRNMPYTPRQRQNLASGYLQTLDYVQF